MTSSSPSKILLARLTAQIFNHSYNPSGVRTGNKILRQRLIGPTITNWYPKHLIKLSEITELFPGFKLVDLEEKQRLEDIARLRKRGKGAPKKAKEANDLNARTPFLGK
ncbi:4679_t:CDS:2, partial [Acaulospora colombiana]